MVAGLISKTMMQRPFFNQIEQHFPTQTDFLIGLSGGVDSVALLHLFCQLCQHKPLNLRAIHIHHGLSPNADSWAAFCQTLCEQWQIPLSVQQVQVVGTQGLEANARQARYQAIQAHIQPNEIFCTAHHLDDQVETFFLALKRGAGLKGLSAMQAVSFWQRFTIFRPLLSFSKAELLTYATVEKLPWIEDESNANTQFDRNFLRNDVLPLLNQRWQQFNPMVARASQHCAEQQQLIEELLADELNQRADFAEQSLNIDGFEHFSLLKQQQLIRLWLARCQQPMPSKALLKQIIQQLIFAEKDKNPQVKVGQKMVRRYQQKIFLTEESPFDSLFQREVNIKDVIELPHNLGTLIRTEGSLICKTSHGTTRLLLPVELQNQPLIVQFVAPSKVKCYGKAHREEMKKIWQAHKIPVWQRHCTPLVFFGEELVGILGEEK